MDETNIIPEKFQNEDGTLNGDALIKSYTELEKKIGTMISVPADDSDSSAREKFNRAIGVPNDANEYPMHEMFGDETIRKKFHEMGLTASQAEKIYSMAEEFLSPALTEIYQSSHEANAFAELKTFFGGEQKMIDAMREIDAFGSRFLPTDAYEEMCRTPQGIQGIYKMMQSMEPRVETGKSEAQNLTDNDLRNMMRDPKYWRDHDAEYVRKVENGFKKLYADKN
jgi:hypothetical protein